MPTEFFDCTNVRLDEFIKRTTDECTDCRAVYLWEVTVLGNSVDSSFSSHLDSVTKFRGIILAKRVQSGFKEKARTVIAVTGGCDLFSGASGAISCCGDKTLPVLRIFDSKLLASLGTKDCPVVRVEGIKITDLTAVDPELKSLVSRGKRWMGVNAVDWETRVMSYLYVFILVLLVVPSALIFIFDYMYKALFGSKQAPNHRRKFRGDVTELAWS